MKVKELLENCKGTDWVQVIDCGVIESMSVGVCLSLHGDRVIVDQWSLPDMPYLYALFLGNTWHTM